MSTIINGGLDQYGKVQSLNGIGGERVNLSATCLRSVQNMLQNWSEKSFKQVSDKIDVMEPELYEPESKQNSCCWWHHNDHILRLQLRLTGVCTLHTEASILRGVGRAISHILKSGV